MKYFICEVLIPGLVPDKEIQNDLLNEIKGFSIWDDMLSLPFTDRRFPFMVHFEGRLKEAVKLCRKMEHGNICNIDDMDRKYGEQSRSSNFMEYVEHSSSAQHFIERLTIMLKHLGLGNVSSSRRKELFQAYTCTEDQMETLIQHFTKSSRGLKLYEGRHSMIIDEPLNPILSNQNTPTHRSRRHHAVRQNIGNNLLYFAGNQLFVTAYTGYRLSFANGGINGFDGRTRGGCQ